MICILLKPFFDVPVETKISFSYNSHFNIVDATCAMWFIAFCRLKQFATVLAPRKNVFRLKLVYF